MCADPNRAIVYLHLIYIGRESRTLIWFRRREHAVE